MDNRRSERIADSLDAEIICGDVSYPGILMNFSAEGLYMVTATANSVVDITPCTAIQLKCTLPSGSRLLMDCEVKWFQTRTSPHGVSFSLGMEIKDPPQLYKEFIELNQ